MTTPPTTAGWYPDPDGSGGQRYWDGAAWTAQRPDAPEATEETATWPSELPPWPEDMEMPSWEEAGKAEPVSPDEPVVEEPLVADASLEEASAEDAIADDPALGEAAEEPAITADAEPSVPDEALESAPPEFDPAAEQTTRVHLVDQPTAAVPLPESPPFPPPAAPAAFATFGSRPTPGGPLKGYLAGVGGLLVVLVGVLVWAFAFADPGTGATEANGADGASETAVTTAPTTDSADPTEAAGDGSTTPSGEALDGDVAITNNGLEITPTVSAVDNELLTKSAAGEFVVVRLTLLNKGELPATFLADQQVLTAGGQTFNPETESTFYLGGISAVLYPGQPVDVAFAFDVPPGTAPESLLVHGDLASAGTVLELA
jgi:hypothetical protein